MEANRRMGNTTRAMDYFIQCIFNNPGELITIKDHYDHPSSHRYLLDKILKRLELEHSKRFFIVDLNKLTIMLPVGKDGYKRFVENESKHS